MEHRQLCTPASIPSAGRTLGFIPGWHVSNLQARAGHQAGVCQSGKGGLPSMRIEFEKVSRHDAA